MNERRQAGNERNSVSAIAILPTTIIQPNRGIAIRKGNCIKLNYASWLIQMSLIMRQLLSSLTTYGIIF